MFGRAYLKFELAVVSTDADPGFLPTSSEQAQSGS